MTAIILSMTFRTIVVIIQLVMCQCRKAKLHISYLCEDNGLTVDENGMNCSVGTINRLVIGILETRSQTPRRPQVPHR